MIKENCNAIYVYIVKKKEWGGESGETFNERDA